MSKKLLQELDRAAKDAQNALVRAARERLKPGTRVWAFSWSSSKKVRARVESFFGKSYVSLVAEAGGELDRHTLAQLIELNPDL